MAELASGAVHSLLGVLRDEAQQLGRVEGDVKFIKEEMESMNSFLQHLARTTPPGGEHDEQVRTWMKQVRDLAYDCSNCIDLYLLRGDPAVYRATGPVERYLWWVPWYLKKLYAQHSAAIQLRELKARARDVGKRRLRYGVEIPQKSVDKQTTTTTLGGKPSGSEATSSPSLASGGGDEGIIPSDDEQTPKDEANALAFAERRIMEECTQELVDWLLDTEEMASWPWLNEDRFPSIAIAAPDKEDGADVTLEALAHPSVATKFDHKLWINDFPWFWPAGPSDILEKILGKLLPEPREGERAKRPKSEELDRKIDVIVKKTKEHLPAAGTEKSPRVVPLEPLDILCDILQELQSGGKDQIEELQSVGKDQIEELQSVGKDQIEELQSVGKDQIEELQSVGKDQIEELQSVGKDQIEELQSVGKDQIEELQSVGKDQIEEKINETAMKIKEYMEELETRKSWIGLDHSEYVGILRELLPQPKQNKPVKEATDKLGDDQIAKNIKEILQELHSKPQEDKSAVKEDMVKLGKDHIEEKIKETTEHIIDNMLRRKLLPNRKEDMDKLDEDQMSEEKIEEIIENIEGTLQNIKEHLLVKEIANKIREHLEGKRTIIVLDDINAYKWLETKRDLNQLGFAAGSAVIVITRYTQGSEKFCYPTREAIVYSLVHYYYSKVLRFTSRRKNKDWNVCILYEILQLCEPHELYMKLFVHAFCANPDKSKEELEKLRDSLVFSQSLEANAKKMLMFSYGDLHRDYRTCFVYLAIFPRGHKIRRSTLVGRWVAEGLITKEDWPSSVHRAERCFDVLVNQCLVYPGDIGAAGKVKSCIVHDIVHEFITKIARKEHFVETRLSHRWARHFSVLSDVRLRSSDCIENFLQNLYRIPQLPLVKVLDLEDCRYFKENQHYLKNICSKMLLLKYLSLRNTDITKLPKEINNLHQLEVLDIRQTHVDASSTRYIMLLKLKRLLASFNIDQTPTRTDNINRTKKSFDAVELPRGIEKMTNMEVLSHIEISAGGAHLKDIGSLWQLRKLGVVIHDKQAHLKNLVQVIDDLNERLQSLSISIKPLQASSHGRPSNTDISLKNSLKLLKSLRICGMTSEWLLTLLVKHCDQLAKVTLHNTHLNQGNLKYLGQLPKLRCFRLQHVSYTESNLTFNNQEFQNLKYFRVEGSNMTEISFEDEAAPELEEIVLSSAKMKSISFANEAAPELEKIVLSSANITSISFGNGAAPKLEEIALSSTNITSITFGNEAALKLEKIALSSTTISSVTFENGATPNLKKIVLSSFTNVEFLSVINYLPVLKELELNSGRIAGALLSLFTNANQLAKVTLRDTLLKQGDLQILAKQPNLRCLMLLDKSCDERQLTFNKEEFRNLKLLVVECFGVTKISFDEGAAPKLEKIVWSFTDIQSLSGIDNLLELKELEFKGDKIPDRVRVAIDKHPKHPFLIHTKQRNQDKEEEAQQQRILDSN